MAIISVSHNLRKLKIEVGKESVTNEAKGNCAIGQRLLNMQGNYNWSVIGISCMIYRIPFDWLLINSNAFLHGYVNDY